MRRFLASGWYPLLACVVFAAAAAGSYALLKPTGIDVGNDQIVRAFGIAGWATPVLALASLLLMCFLNGIRRLCNIRNVGILHPLVVLLGILPWLLFGMQLVAFEPRYTPFARAAIDFVGVPMLWGALAATLFTLILALGLLVPGKKA
jgi:hypothetical protein